MVTDEQHRFGVRQREMLAEKGVTPHVLVMSATPIPRTLAMIVYGDLDISVVDEMPANRLPIKNCVVDESYRPNAYRFMEKEAAAGHQIYIICPMVEESDELKNRGVKDILIICADGLTGIKEAIATAFPKTEYQRCIVHQVRNTLKYVPDKDRKAFATDLKTIYQAADEQKALAALDRVTEKWTPKYPNSMKRWKDNWDAVSPIFKFSTTVRKVIYTTNAIESLNSTYRKLNRQRSVFPSDTALLKALYLATFEATKKWTTTIRDWGQVYGELSIMYEGRLPE